MTNGATEKWKRKKFEITFPILDNIFFIGDDEFELGYLGL